MPVVIVGVIRRKPVLTHASIVCEGMLASVNSVNSVKMMHGCKWQTYVRKSLCQVSSKSQVFKGKSQVKSQVITGKSQVKSRVFQVKSQVKSQVLYVKSRSSRVSSHYQSIF